MHDDGPSHLRILLPTRSPLVVIGISFLGLILVGVLDYLTGYEFGFYIFYLIPISYLAWRVNIIPALLFSVIAAVIWLAVDILSEHTYSLWFAVYWNAAIRLVTFGIVALALSRIRTDLEKSRGLNAKLTKALQEVRKLSGLLPICAACKNIRNDQGYWQQMESYVKEHSEAEFTHSICPNCAATLYPDLHIKEPRA